MKLKARSGRGFAMALSLFLVLILYTAMTIMMANLKSDWRLSEQAIETAQSRFATLGAVNKLFVLLQNGASPSDYTATSPLEVDIGHFSKVKAWVVEDNNTGVFHLVSQFNGTSFSKVITNQPELGARTYINNGGVLASAGADDTSWTDLPAPPPKAYNLQNEQVDCTDLACGYNPRANSKGQLVANFYSRSDSSKAMYLWDERSQSWSDISPPRVRPPAMSATQLLLEINTLALGEKNVYTWQHEGAENTSSLSFYDLETQTWSDVQPGPFDGATIVNGMVGPSDSFVAEVFHDGQRRAMQLVDGTWSDLAPLPNNATLEKLNTQGHDGEIYATGTDGRVYKLEQDTWSTITMPAPNRILMSVDAEDNLILANSEDTSQLFRWDQSTDPTALPEFEEFWGAAGGGEGGQNTSDGYKATASF
jgi:hypothetical protein